MGIPTEGSMKETAGEWKDPDERWWHVKNKNESWLSFFAKGCFWSIRTTRKIDWACFFVSITVLGLAIWDTHRIENSTLKVCGTTFLRGHYYVKSAVGGGWWPKSILWMHAIHGSLAHGDQFLLKCVKYPAAAILLLILVSRNLEVNWNPFHYL
ncbi:hypothetical protein JCM16303_006001 [Sporobolomyces ruberrimus]